MGPPSEISEKQEPREASRPVDSSSKKPHSSRRWGLFSPKSKTSSDNSDGTNFLLSASGPGTTTTVTTLEETFWPVPESERGIEPMR